MERDSDSRTVLAERWGGGDGLALEAHGRCAAICRESGDTTESLCVGTSCRRILSRFEIICGSAFLGLAQKIAFHCTDSVELEEDFVWTIKDFLWFHQFSTYIVLLAYKN